MHRVGALMQSNHRADVAAVGVAAADVALNVVEPVQDANTL